MSAAEKPVVASNQRYRPCHSCGGQVTERSVVVDYRWNGRLVAIIEDVPAGVCEACGEQYFKAAVVHAMERAARLPSKAGRKITVPIRAFS